MVFAYDLSAREIRSLVQLVTKDAKTLQQWCKEVDFTTKREEWAHVLTIALTALLEQLNNTFIEVYPSEDGSKKYVLIDKSDVDAKSSSLNRMGFSIDNVCYYLKQIFQSHGSGTRRLNVNAYLILLCMEQN